MARIFETGEITKLLDVLIGKTEAVGETNQDERRLDNLKTLIDVTNWCLDGLQFAMASGYGRPEYSMAEISYTAQCALDEYGRWIADVLDEQIADRKDEPQTCETCKHYGVVSVECDRCDKGTHSRYEPKAKRNCGECIHLDNVYKRELEDGTVLIGTECDGADEVCDKWQTDCPWK